MQGDFVQQSADGRTAEGIFYLRRPGRLRFEYFDPYPTTVVSDGTWAGIMNRDLNKTDRIPLSRTPLYLLLRDNVDLGAEGAIQSVERAPGVVRARAIDPSNPNDGSITMIFGSNPVELQKWIITDAQNRSSVITLRNVRSGLSIDPRKFLIEDLNENSGFVTGGGGQ
jgi:outer membrane lipoprotein-sorting protein